MILNTLVQYLQGISNLVPVRYRVDPFLSLPIFVFLDFIADMIFSDFLLEFWR